MHAMTGSWFRRLCAAAVLVAMAPALAHAQQFPFDQEMLLETPPMPGSRRVPILEVHPDGRATLDMWCHSAVAQIAISGSEFKLTFVSAKPGACNPDRIERDQALAKAIMEVTSWRRQNDIVTLVGPTSFRFRISTH